MAELYPSDAELNALSGTSDAEQEILFLATGESPYYTSFYKMLYRLLDAAKRAGDLRVFKDGDLTFGVRAGRFFNGDTTVNYSQATGQSLTNNATNYIYLTADGTLTKNTTGFPVPSVTPHIPLATVVTSGGEYGHDDITDYRGRAFLTVCGSGAGNLNALDWQESVADELDFTTAEPGSPTQGDRYLNTGTGSSSETEQSITANRIYEWNGTSWTEITPNEGACCLVEDRDMLIGYNGSAWVDISTFALLAEAKDFFGATDISGAEAETLTDGSNADSLHKHDTAGLEDEAVTAAKLGYAPDALVVVQRGATDAASGTNLAAAYTAAKSLTPGGNALAAGNRACVLIPPGGYSLSTRLLLDTNYVDLLAMHPSPGRPIQDDEEEWTGTKDVATPSVLNTDITYQPPATLVYGSIVSASRETGIVRQSANDVRLFGFGIANLHQPGGTTDLDTGADYSYCANAFWISAADNTPSKYEMMWFWQSAPGVWRTNIGWCRASVLATVHYGGHWKNCISNGFGFRLYTPGTFDAVMEDIIGGAFSFCGDTDITISGQFYRCRCIGHYNSVNAASYEKGCVTTPYSGFAGFVGCRTFTAGTFTSAAYFEDCKSGDHSFGLGDTVPPDNEATFVRCTGGRHCMGGTVSGLGVNFTGVAIQCAVLGNSLGGGHANSRCKGKLYQCYVGGRTTNAMHVEGATIWNSVIKSTGTNEDCLILEDSVTQIIDSVLLVNQGGNGIPINDDGNARTVIAAHCRMNNASNDADGLGANVTNNGSGCIVIDNLDVPRPR